MAKSQRKNPFVRVLNDNIPLILLLQTIDFIRKMRITGLISIRGAGRFIDINSNEKETVDYILKTYTNYFYCFFRANTTSIPIRNLHLFKR